MGAPAGGLPVSWEERGYGTGGSHGGGRGFADNPLNWAPTIARIAGIRVRVHIVFLLYILFELLRTVEIYHFTAQWLFVLFGSVFLHELGHCFSARRVGGTADEVLMWPLGGLAFVSVPRRPWPEFVSVVWGPLVNVILFTIAAVILRFNVEVNPYHFLSPIRSSWGSLHAWMVLIYEVNTFLFLFNLWPMYPMDGGRLLKCAVWWKSGLHKATAVSTAVGMIAAVVMGFYGLLFSHWFMLGIAIMGYLYCHQERKLLKAGALQEADGFMGYDFSGGYSTLEPETKKRRGAFAKWRDNRAQARKQSAEEAAAKQQQEVDRILEKVHREGIQTLTGGEKRTLEAASKDRKDPERNRV